MRRFLIIEGGGMKGFIPAVALDTFNDYLQDSNIEWDLYFNGFFGASVGAILATTYASGLSPHFVMANFPDICERGFRRDLKTIFSGSKYSSKYVRDEIEKIIPITRMYQIKNILGISAVDLTASPNKNVMFTNRSASQRNVFDLLEFSYAAPYFFGYRRDPVTNRVYADGGTGNANTPIFNTINCLYEQYPELIDEKIELIVLGTGNYYHDENEARYGSIREVIDFLKMSREQAETTQLRLFDNIGKKLDINVKYFDISIDKQYDGMDKPEWEYYYKKGQQLGEMMVKELIYGEGYKKWI